MADSKYACTCPDRSLWTLSLGNDLSGIDPECFMHGGIIPDNRRHVERVEAQADTKIHPKSYTNAPGMDFGPNSTDELIPDDVDLGDGTAPPEENFWDDRTTPGAYSESDSARDLERLRVLAVMDHVLGGPDFNPEGSGWFKPWATCPTCKKVLVAWTDKALWAMIESHCQEVGCAMPEL